MSTIKKKKPYLFLDSKSKLNLDQFVWPISYKETCEIRDSLEKDFISKLNVELPRKNFSWKILRILMFEIFRDTLMCWQLNELKNRLSKLDFDVKIPEIGYDFLKSLYDQELFTFSSISSSLKNGISKPPKYKMPLRYLKNSLLHRDIKFKFLKDINKNDIVLLSNNNFIINHANLIQKKDNLSIFLVSFWEWFNLSKQEKQSILNYNNFSEHVLDELLHIIENTFKKFNSNFSPLIEKRLKNWIKISSNFVGFYLERIYSNPELIPKTLWYGSVNNWWTRIIRTCVLETGGINVGHDHGPSLGFAPNSGQHVTHFDLCDVMYTYSNIFCQSLVKEEKEIKKRTPQNRCPKFFHASSNCVTKPKNFDKKYSNQIPFYLSPIYLGERISGLNLHPLTPVFVDWQKRFLSELKKEFSNFVFKAHPESILSPPINFLKKNNIIIETKNFDHVLQKASMFVIDYATTPIKAALSTNKPILIIEHEFCRIPKHLELILEKRCAILKTNFKNNLINANMNKLHLYLQLSKKRANNTECFNTLYNLK